MNIWVHPDALTDLADARDYYRKQVGLSLSANFIFEFERTTHLLMMYPAFGTPSVDGIRTQTMRRFPYTVVYKLIGNELRVLAVAHQSRKPGFWRGRQ